jgi:hypothetical protein
MSAVATTEDYAILYDILGTLFVLNLDNFVMPCLLFNDKGPFPQVDPDGRTYKPSAGMGDFENAKPGKDAARVYFDGQLKTLNFVRKERFWSCPPIGAAV